MEVLFYKLERLPDLTLSKYSSLGESGVEGVLARHKAFLRQWQRISLIERVSLHLIIYYEPLYDSGKRLNVYIEIACPDEETRTRCNQLILASPLIDYFVLDCSFNDYIELAQKTFIYKTVLTKRERKYESIFYKDNGSSEPLLFFTVPGWETNEDARLIDMLKIMKALNKAVIYRVDLFGSDAYDTVYEALKVPINKLREITKNRHADKISLTSDKSFNLDTRPKDAAAEETLKQYEEFLGDLGSNPYFRTNISVLMDDRDEAQIILDAAGAEAMDKGDFTVRLLEKGKYCAVPTEFSPAPFKSIVPDKLSFWPTLFSLDEIAPFFRFPVLFDGETLEMPKETEPKKESGGLYLGTDINGHEVYFPIKNLNKHIFIAGTPGSGKTNTMLHLCYSLWMKHRIPFLVLEPAKQEYRSLALTDIDELMIFSPSSGSPFPLAINPFEFVLGLSLSEHIQNLMSVFEGAFPLDPPLPALLDRSMESIYRELGWDPEDINTGEKEYPTMSQLYTRLEKELAETDYDNEIRGNMKSALEMRIGGLLRRDLGNVFNVSRSSIKPEEWIKSPIIIELESLGEGPSNFLALILCTVIRESIKINPGANPEMTTRHVMFIEEAHNLIGPASYIPNTGSGSNADPKIAATAYIIKMLAEVRALREGIVIADQLPTALAPEVIKNTGMKIAHRITAGDDRSLIGQTMSATELQLEELATFNPGNTLISFEGLLKPFKMQVALAPNKDDPAPDNTDLNLCMEKFPKFLSARNRYIGNMIRKMADRFEEIAVELKNQDEWAEKLINKSREYLQNNADFKSAFAEDYYKLKDRNMKVLNHLNTCKMKCNSLLKQTNEEILKIQIQRLMIGFNKYEILHSKYVPEAIKQVGLLLPEKIR